MLLQSAKEQPDCWRANEPHWNGLVALRVRSDYRRALAPYGLFICGVRTPESRHSLFRLSVSSESSKQDPRLFGLLEVGSVALVSLVPFSQSCHYEHIAFNTAAARGPLTLKLLKQQGPLPTEVCVFDCQSSQTPLNTCAVRSFQRAGAPAAVAAAAPVSWGLVY